jgi:hypothetical protein
MSRATLSPDEWFSIIKNLPVSDVTNLLRISQLHNEFNNEDTWKYLLERDYPDYVLSEKEGYRDAYRRYHELDSILRNVNPHQYNVYISKLSIPEIYDFIVTLYYELNKTERVYGITLEALITILNITLLDRKILVYVVDIIHDRGTSALITSIDVKKAIEEMIPVDTVSNTALSNIKRMNVDTELVDPTLKDVVYNDLSDIKEEDIVTTKIEKLITRKNSIIVYVRDDKIRYLDTSTDLNVLSELEYIAHMLASDREDEGDNTYIPAIDIIDNLLTDKRDDYISLIEETEY